MGAFAPPSAVCIGLKRTFCWGCLFLYLRRRWAERSVRDIDPSEMDLGRCLTGRRIVSSSAADERRRRRTTVVRLCGQRRLPWSKVVLTSGLSNCCTWPIRSSAVALVWTSAVTIINKLDYIKNNKCIPVLTIILSLSYLWMKCRKMALDLPPHLKYVDPLPREIWIFNCIAVHSY